MNSLGAAADALICRAQYITELVEDTPEVAIDLECVRRNIRVAAYAARDAGIELRPHIKTHKLPLIAQIQIEAGSRGIQVAKLGEAEVMANAGINDILVGYPLIGHVKLRRLFDLWDACRITVTVDSDEYAIALAEAARSRGVTIEVMLEIDSGLGRLGRSPGLDALAFGERVSMLDGLEVVGVFTHEGHVYTQASSDAEREQLTREACATVVETAALLRERGIAAEVVSVGSSGTFRFAIQSPGVTEVRPGTYVFNDRTQLAQNAASHDDLAAFVVATVVARPARERVVIDAGSKTLSSDRMIVREPEISYGMVVGHPDWLVTRVSEEHGMLSVPADAKVVIGARVAIVPNHICSVVNLANTVTIVDDSGIERVPVAARGKVQ